MIESQASYIARLSETHSVSVGTLIGKELAPVLAKKFILKSSLEGGSRFFDAASEVNGFGKVAEDCSQGLEILTGGTDLKNLTLVSWNQMIPSRGVLREKKHGVRNVWKNGRKIIKTFTNHCYGVLKP